MTKVYTHIHMQRFGWRAQREGKVWSNPGHPIIFLSTCSPDVLVSPHLQMLCTCSSDPIVSLEQGLLLLLEALPCSPHPGQVLLVPAASVLCGLTCGGQDPPILTSSSGLGTPLGHSFPTPQGLTGTANLSDLKH